MINILNVIKSLIIEVQELERIMHLSESKGIINELIKLKHSLLDTVNYLIINTKELMKHKTCPSCESNNIVFDDRFPVLDTYPEMYSYLCKDCHQHFDNYCEE